MAYRRSTLLGFVSAITVTVALWSWHARAAPAAVSQRGRAFQPNEIQLQAGDTVSFINDDQQLLHHAYLTASGFSFDTGEQEPGTTARVRFTTAGTFTVLCGIHPKMRLSVTVR